MQQQPLAQQQSLVQQHSFTQQQPRTCNGHALALPSRERVCGPVHELLHVDQLQRHLHCITHLLLRQHVPAAKHRTPYLKYVSMLM